MTLYEMNKISYQNAPPLTEKGFEAGKQYITDFIDSIVNFDLENNKYLMLLCNELHYYTIFAVLNHDYKVTLQFEILDIINELGEVVDIIDETSNHSIEFWIRDKETKEINMYVLFDYTRGVIEI